MKEQTICKIVEDLLPNYIERLTSEETNRFIEEHIDTCERCRQLWKVMNAEIRGEKQVPATELKFLKKIKKARVAAGIFSIILALLFVYLLYSAEFKYTHDKGVLSAAITEYVSSSLYPVDAYVLETREIKGVLIAYFKDHANPNVYGFARLSKGINQKYRLMNVKYKPIPYATGAHMYSFKIGDEAYVAVGCHRCVAPAAAYGLRILGDHTFEGKDVITFAIPNEQFLEIHKEAEILDAARQRTGIENVFVFSDYSSIVLANGDGEDITERFKVDLGEQNWSASTATAGQFMLYVFMIIVLVLGGVLARYFLSEK